MRHNLQKVFILSILNNDNKSKSLYFGWKLTYIQSLVSEKCIKIKLIYAKNRKRKKEKTCQWGWKNNLDFSLNYVYSADATARHLFLF